MTDANGSALDYGYEDAAHSCAHEYCLPTVERIFGSYAQSTVRDLRCGKAAATYSEPAESINN
jgi:hypothetical protein